MPRSRKSVDIREFHARAVAAVQAGKSMREFAREQNTLANNVKAMLYEAVVLQSLSPVTFPEPTRGGRARKEKPSNISEVQLYTGRAKMPYLTLKVPRQIVAASHSREGDKFEWRLNRKGEIVGTMTHQAAEVSEDDRD